MDTEMTNIECETSPDGSGKCITPNSKFFYNLLKDDENSNSGLATDDDDIGPSTSSDQHQSGPGFFDESDEIWNSSGKRTPRSLHLISDSKYPMVGKPQRLNASSENVLTDEEVENIVNEIIAPARLDDPITLLGHLDYDADPAKMFFEEQKCAEKFSARKPQQCCTHCPGPIFTWITRNLILTTILVLLCYFLLTMRQAELRSDCSDLEKKLNRMHNEVMTSITEMKSLIISNVGISNESGPTCPSNKHD